MLPTTWIRAKTDGTQYHRMHILRKKEPVLLFNIILNKNTIALFYPFPFLPPTLPIKFCDSLREPWPLHDSCYIYTPKYINTT